MIENRSHFSVLFQMILVKLLKENLSAVRVLADDLVRMAAIVGAIAVFDYFWSEAIIEFNVRYIDHAYNELQIRKQLALYKLDTAIKTLSEAKGSFGLALPDTSKFTSSSPLIETQSSPDSREIEKLKSSIEFKPSPIVGNYRNPQQLMIINKHFWERSFADLLIQKTDSLTAKQALQIILANREVYSVLFVHNSGRLPAKEITFSIRRPYLLWPRYLSNRAKVEFKSITSEYENFGIIEHKPVTKINLPYLKPGETASFDITTTLQNLSNEQIIALFDTDRKIDSKRLKMASIITLFSYFFLLPLIFRGYKWAVRRIKE